MDAMTNGVEHEGPFYRELLESSLSDNPSSLDRRWVASALLKVEIGEEKAGMVERYMPLAGKRALDIGCGDGGISIAFARKGAIVTGIDCDQNRIKRARIWAREHGVTVDFRVEDGERVRFGAGSFDLVICNAVIEHVHDPLKLVEEMSRMLKAGGLLFLDTPNKHSVVQLISDTHFGLFGISMLPRTLAEFYVVRVRKKHNRYPVDELRTYGFLKKICGRNNIVFLEDANIRQLQSEVKNPELVRERNDRRAKAIRLVQRLYLSGFARHLVGGVFYRHFVTSGWSLICRKIKE